MQTLATDTEGQYKKAAITIAEQCRVGLFKDAKNGIQNILDNSDASSKELTAETVENFKELGRTITDNFDFNKPRRAGHFIISRWPLNNIAEHFKQHGNGHTSIGKAFEETVKAIDGVNVVNHYPEDWDQPSQFIPR